MVAKIQIVPPRSSGSIGRSWGLSRPSQVKMPDNNNLPTLGMAQSPQVALASQGRAAVRDSARAWAAALARVAAAERGPGSGGGYGGGLMSVGGGVSAPVVIHSVEPEFTDDARRANYQGSVSIKLIVDSQGNPQDVRLASHLGMGLDEKAIEAVRQYKFSRPCIRDILYQCRSSST
jgi:protein TonB